MSRAVIRRARRSQTLALPIIASYGGRRDHEALARQRVEQLRHVVPQRLRADVGVAAGELLAQLVEVPAFGRQELPHLEADGIETEIDLLLHVEQDRSFR